jgi:hypothetical protein
MTSGIDAAGRLRPSEGTDTGGLDGLDRILLGICAVIWLAALGAAVAATVALVDLGSGHPPPSGSAETPWLLYSVIGISAAVIVGAVPLLLRARRTAMAEPQPPVPAPAAAAAPAPSIRGGETPTEKLRVFRSDPIIRRRPSVPAPSVPGRYAPGAPVAAVDQLWLRCGVVIASAIGLATAAVGVSTYLMASDHDTAAWAVYGVAGLVTLAMPAVPWFYLRELRRMLNS